MSKKDRDELVLSHYREQAALSGDSMCSTMPDETIRKREIETLLSFASFLHKNNESLRAIDVGCGNGYTLELLARQFPNSYFTGLDFSPEMLALAEERKLGNIELFLGDTRDLKQFKDGEFDFAYTIRCLMNILTWEEQREALEAIYRILKPGGHFLMMEYFDDGFKNFNRLRIKFGVEPLRKKYHNKYLPKEELQRAINGKFAVVHNRSFPYNYLSSYYFFSRVIYPALAKLFKAEVRHNHWFVKLFTRVPAVGNFAPPQAFILKKL